MTLPSPVLDDSSYEQLRKQLVDRIPYYNPEWSDHNPSDPGITLLELFAYLSEHVLFRFNQIPEKTYLEFLNLLQVPRLPAQPARAMLTFSTSVADGVSVDAGSQVAAGEQRFETDTALRVWPFSSMAFSKQAQPLPDVESEDYARIELAMDALAGFVSNGVPLGYQPQPIDPASGSGPVNLDESVDDTLWIAVLNELDEQNDVVLERLRQGIRSKQPSVILNIGLVADDAAPDVMDIDPCPGPDAASNARPVQWQVSTAQLIDTEPPVYRPVRVVQDTTFGLTEQGVVRLELTADDVGGFVILDDDMSGGGDLPPVVDDDQSDKVLFWLRAFRPVDEAADRSLGRVRLVSLNASEATQAVKARPEFLGSGSGQPSQTFRLHHSPVIADSLEIEVEDHSGWRRWRQVDGFHASQRGDLHYVLDAVTGAVTFGRIEVPQIGQRIRARAYRHGGGRGGNVAAAAINKIARIAEVKVENPLAAAGGADDETIEASLSRIPGELRRRDRAVTPGDFRELAQMTPGADIGRAETIELYRPATGDLEAAGVVTVVVWPTQDTRHPNAPVPSRGQLQQVCRWLDKRRLVTTEVYVIAPRYRQLTISVGVELKPGFAVDAVRSWVELVLRQYLAPMPPFGPEGHGWPLSRNVSAPELEAVVSQVEGVRSLVIDDINRGLRLKELNENSGEWQEPPVVIFQKEFVPEVIGVTVVEGPPLDPEAALAPAVGGTPVPIPVEVEEC